MDIKFEKFKLFLSFNFVVFGNKYLFFKLKKLMSKIVVFLY